MDEFLKFSMILRILRKHISYDKGLDTPCCGMKKNQMDQNFSQNSKWNSQLNPEYGIFTLTRLHKSMTC